METPKLDDLQKKTTGIVTEGFRVIKDGLREAGRLLGATADATKLHIEKEAKVIETHRDFHRLGEEVYRLMKESPGVVEIKITSAMREIMRRIKAAEKNISISSEQLSHMTVVTSQKKTLKSKGSKKGAKKAVPRRAQKKKVTRRRKAS